MVRSFGSKWFSVALLIILSLALGMWAWGMDDAGLWDAAMVKYQANDLPGAAAIFNQLITEYSSSPRVPGAKLKLAEIARLTNPKASTADSVRVLSEIMDQYPGSPEAAEALVQQGFLYAKTRQPADTG